MIRALRLPFAFDPALLARDLARAELAAWSPHFNRGTYRGDWSGIDLRAAPSQRRALFTPPDLEHAIQDLPLLDELPYLRHVLRQFECPLRAARLLRLAPGGHILRHRDAMHCYEHGDIRIHVPLRTDPAVRFLLDDEAVELRVGECWYLNFDLPHEIVNHGTQDRVHLVLDAKVDAWVDALFARARIAA